MIDLSSLISSARKAHPAFSYFTVAVGIVASAATIVKFGLNPIALTVVTILLVILAIVFFLFAQLTKKPGAAGTTPVKVHGISYAVTGLMWAGLIVFLAACSSLFLDKPVKLRTAVEKIINPSAPLEPKPIPRDLTVNFIAAGTEHTLSVPNVIAADRGQFTKTARFKVPGMELGEKILSVGRVQPDLASDPRAIELIFTASADTEPFIAVTMTVPRKPAGPTPDQPMQSFGIPCTVTVTTSGKKPLPSKQ
jgi:hypothetical protein